MKLLAVDTSTHTLSLAVSEGDKALGVRNSSGGQKVSQRIIPAISALLDKVDIKPKNLDGFVVGLGPGSFTSLRVGLSAMKAMAFSLNKPLIGISSMDAVAHRAPDGPITVILDAKRQLLYCAQYVKGNKKLTRHGEYRLTDIQSVLSCAGNYTIFTGDGIEIFKKDLEGYRSLDKKYWKPQAKHLLKLGLKRFVEKSYDDVDSLVPLYLYREDCQVTVKSKS